jgi:hypothetical protein
VHRSKIKLLVLSAAILMVVAAACLIFGPAPKAPSVKLTITGWRTNKTDTFTQLQLTNAGTTPIVYVGFQRDRPLYTVYVKKDAGLQSSSYMCTTGAQDWILRPGEAVSFTALSRDVPYRIEVIYTSPSSAYKFYASFPDWITHWLPEPSPPPILTVVASMNR